MGLIRSLLLFSLPSIVSAANSALPDKFQLYGYGSGTNDIGGFPLFYADGYVYMGDVTRANGTDAAGVAFSRGTNNNLSGVPTNETNGAQPSWSNVLLSLPASDTTDKRLKFKAPTNVSNGDVTTGFVFYGVTVMHKNSAGQLESAFTALRLDGRVSQLYWNDTSLGQEQVVVRAMQPSNPPN